MAVPRRIVDWDDAYANMPHIPGGADYPPRWAEMAKAFRERLLRDERARLGLAYGPRARNRLDLFLPSGAPRGLLVFVHGGYWMRFDPSFWSHLAAGPLARGFAVAMPGYTLCPDIAIGGIVEEIAGAVSAAAGEVEGPLVLSGHSAGGHLVTRLACRASPLADAPRRRLRRVVSISGLHDLRPLLRTEMNSTLRLSPQSAGAESPALAEPLEGLELICWVGAAERAEFLRQNALLANVWTGLGAETLAIEEPDRHHFDVIDGLADPAHPLCRLACA
jgi:acetyl esterase/lipase